MTLEEISWFVDDTVKRALQGQPGIGKIDRYGGADREVRVALDESRLNAYGVTASDVNAQLRQTNRDLGSGRGQVGGAEQAIRHAGRYALGPALASQHDRPAQCRFVRLTDLGTVTDTYQSRRASRASTAFRSSPSPCSAPRAPAK